MNCIQNDEKANFRFRRFGPYVIKSVISEAWGGCDFNFVGLKTRSRSLSHISAGKTAEGGANFAKTSGFLASSIHPVFIINSSLRDPNSKLGTRLLPQAAIRTTICFNATHCTTQPTHLTDSF